MKKYGNEELQTFLKVIDSELDGPFELRIIGGTAIALGYHAFEFTRDIDTVNSIEAIRGAYEAAKRKTGLDIPMGPVGVEDGPHDYESRLVVPDVSGLTKLIIKIPERHDLILMKMVRGAEHDIQAAVRVHEEHPLSFETLLHRMKSEMTHVIGNKRHILENFLAMIEAIFGEDRALDAQRVLEGWEGS